MYSIIAVYLYVCICVYICVWILAPWKCIICNCCYRAAAPIHLAIRRGSKQLRLLNYSNEFNLATIKNNWRSFLFLIKLDNSFFIFRFFLVAPFCLGWSWLLYGLEIQYTILIYNGYLRFVHVFLTMIILSVNIP